MNQYKKYIYLILLIELPCAMTLAQDLDKVVFVESAFKPNIENAEKMGYMPALSDTLKPKPEINYSVLPSRIDAKYKIKPIKPAKLVGSPIDRLYNSRVKLGIGNYTTPMAEFSIHNLRSKEYAVGAYAYHKSSHTKLRLGNGHKVPAGYGINRVSAYGKRFYRDLNIEGELGFNSHKSRFYGYNTQNFPDSSLPSMENKEIRQWYSQVKARAEVYSTIPDSNAFQYRFGILADYFSDDYANSQNHVEVPGQISFNIESFRLDLNATYHHFHSIMDTLRGANDYVFQFRPILTKRSEQWEVHVGANAYFSSYGKANFFPEAQLSFVVIDKALEAYFGVTGNLEVNHFSKIASENIYITPGLTMKNTKNKLVGYGGLKGALSSNSGYKLEARFESMEDMYFFVNDTNDLLENKFVAVYDDVERISVTGEFWYSPLTFLDFYARTKYNSYTTALEAKPWHMPGTELTFTTQYNYEDKIYASLDIIHQGQRYAKNFDDADNPIELKAFWDVNLRLEYKYSNVLSAFINVHNILAQQYTIWNQYPTQKLNAMIGFSYKF